MKRPRSKSLVLIFLLLIFLFDTGTPSPAQAYGEDPLIKEKLECTFCLLFNEIYTVGQGLIDILYTGLGKALGNFGWNLLTVYLLWSSLVGTALGRGEILIKMGQVGGAVAFSLWMLEDFNYYTFYIQDPLESMTLGIAKFILTSVGGLKDLSYTQVGFKNTDNLYSEMFAIVEYQIVFIIDFVIENIFKTAGVQIWYHIMGVLLLLPYIFVVGIFGAFMIESMFKFIAIGLVSPILIAFFGFPFGRKWAMAGINILIGAGTTMIFAAAAMGVTISAVDFFIENLTSANTSLSAVQERCTTTFGDETDNVEYKHCYFETVFTADEHFLVFFLTGFISVLLHLQAKALASNISGANDGAGPAAATVAAAKLTLGAGVGVALKSLAGRGGLGSLVAELSSGFSSSSNVAQAGVQHGALGALGYGANRMMTLGSSPTRISAKEMDMMQSSSNWNNSVGYPGSSGGEVNLSKQSMEGLAEMMKTGGKGGGRSRFGSG